jgi:hypothetical protein
MAAVAIRGVVEDIGGRDEALERKAALDFKVQPARVGVPPVLERNETGSIENCGESAIAVLAPASPPRRIAA